jgi:hypothetical protein
MKTKVKMIFAISLIAALFIGFMIGVSVDYPNPNKSDLAGTFGKAEKFRKVQMTEKDLQLRSDLVKDTARLRSMIQGLVYFSLFTEELRTNLDMCTISFSAQGMGTQADESGKIKVMKDYSDFIRNNNASLNATIVMLTAFYGKDGGDASQDVERTLQDFGNYVSNMSKKDSILSQVLVNMDEYLLNSKTLQSREAEFRQLKSIRDQLLVKGIQFGGLLGNKGVVVSRMKYAMDTQLKYTGVSSMDFHPLLANPATAGNASLFSGMSAQNQMNVQLEGFYNAQVASQVDSKVSAVVYDSKALEFKVVDLQALTALKQSLDGALKAGGLEGALKSGGLEGSLKSGAMDAALLQSKGLNSMAAQPILMIKAGGDLQVILSQFSVGQMVSSSLLSGLSMESSLKLCQISSMNAMNAQALEAMNPLNMFHSALESSLLQAH